MMFDKTALPAKFGGVSFTGRNLGWCGMGPGNDCGPIAGGGASHKHETHHGHHRKRRFRVARQALGHGYASYDVGVVAKAPVPEASIADSPEIETLSEQEIARKTSRRGMWVCFAIISALFLILQSKWMWVIYFVFAQAWTDIHGSLASH